MSSVSSSDARKDLELGFGRRARKMDENEVDDGEASSCSNGHSSDFRVDPEIALSYIDEKLENVLGHFHKDFEGGVSAENLGAKFGGYGSFLPMYQLSPPRSLPKSPQKVQNHIFPRSPNNSSLEGGRSNCSASTTARQVYVSRSSSKDSSSKVLVKLKECVKSSNRRTSGKEQEFAAKSSCSTSSKKNLRVHIKVGSSDLTSRKNVLACGGQVLGASPSTLLEKSLSESDGGFLGGLEDSPTTILMAMISFPLHTDLLLSPLSNHLIQLGEEKEIMKDNSRYFRVAKLNSENTHDLMDIPDSQKCDTKFSIAKKEKLTETVNYLPRSHSLDGNYIASETDKESDAHSCEELVSKTLRLPLLSCLSPMYTHPAKNSKVSHACMEAVEGAMRGVIRNDLAAAVMGSKRRLEENAVDFSAQSVNEEENVIFLNRTKKDPTSKEGECLTMTRESKRERTPLAEHTDKVSQREIGSNLHKKSRKSSSSIAPAIEMLRGESAAVNRNKKTAHANKLQEGIGGSEYIYRKLFGDMGISKEEIQISLVDKVMKGKLSKRNVSDKSLHSEPQLLTPSGNAPPSTLRSISDIARAASAFAMLEDNWVLCEKCQKRRLLPNDMNPDKLPDDWDCSMLSWLPGMNCCTIHQDVTTEAVRRMHPSFEVQGTLNKNYGSSKLLINDEALDNLEKERKRKGLKELASGTSKETWNNLPLVCEPDSKHLTKSSHSSVDRHKIKQNDTWKVSNQLSGEGEMKISRMEIEKELALELRVTSKKPKTGESQLYDVDQPRCDRILKGVTDKLQASSTELMENANASLHYGCDSKDVLRKRKLKDNQEVGGHVTDLRGNTIKKQKRLRVSSSVGKESHVDNGDVDLGRRGSQVRDKECAYHIPSMATASCSFKSSCSRNIKTNNIQEAKGPPIESSPMRMLDPHKPNSGRRKFSGKDESHDAKFRANARIQIYSDSEGFYRTDRPKTTNKKQTIVPDNDLHGLSSGKVMGRMVHSASGTDHHDQNQKFVDLDDNTQYSGKLKTEQSSDRNGQYVEHCTRIKSQPKDSGELSSAPFSEKNHDMVFVSSDYATAGEVRSTEGRSKKIPGGKVSIESGKEDTREYHGPNAKLDANGSQYYASTQKPEAPETIPRKSVQGEMTSEELKNKSVQASGSGQIEVFGQGSVVLSNKTQIIGHADNVGHDKGHGNDSKLKGHDDISSFKRGCSNQAVTNSIKEGTNLKHMADRLKNAGSHLESTSFYFQAALKFLYGASLLESSPEDSKHKSIARSRQIYDSTAKLCEFCAHEYEKYKDMGAAALAYKCMEVAYLRIIYSSYTNMSRSRCELQAALKVIPSERASPSTVVRSSKVTGNQFISSENHSYLSKLLAFSQNVISAMDASRKAQMAFGAAKEKSVDVQCDANGLSSIKRALDFNFQDMEGLLLVVRLAMEAINR